MWLIASRTLQTGTCQTLVLSRWLRRVSQLKQVTNMARGRILNVAEKNDAAKSLSEIMSGGRYRKREGFSRFNKIYEFEYNILNQQTTMTMTSVSGHLLSLEFMGQYRKWYGCRPVALFEAQVQKFCPDNFKDIKRTLEREVRGCNTLIIWTDGDREGENIGFEIIQVCKAVKPTLKVVRARFSEITQNAIQTACRNLQAPDQNVSDAVDVRTELDLRIGAAFTRFQTLRLQKIFPEQLAEQVISYGSCQFPTLGFVVERYKQVQAFIQEPFWKIKVNDKRDDVNAEFSWKRNRLFNHLACLVLYEHCIESPIAKVLDVRSKPKSKWRPQPLDTVELEKLASRKLHINAKETMKIAEKLYTQGMISYPRTETNIFPKDMNLMALVEEQTRDPVWGGFAGQLLGTGVNPRNGSKTDNAHPPIHPIKYTDTLTGNEKKIYEFIVRHFLACCSQDAQGQETTVEIVLAEEKFTAQGLMIIARNYLDVYPYERWNAKEIPVYYKDDEFEPTSIEMQSGETTPPPLLTEADLIALMDKHGIGTDATHAEHIEKIKTRMYVGVRPDGRFVPGQLGMGLVEGYDAMGYEMSKPHLRAELEHDLKLICEGRKNKDDVLQEQVRKYHEVFAEACNQASKIDDALSEYLNTQPQQYTEDDTIPEISLSVRLCPLCGQEMTLKSKKDGKGFYIGCMNYPECKAAIWLPDSVLSAEVEDVICSDCHPGPVRKIKFRFKRGSVPSVIPLEYSGCIGGCDELLVESLGIKQLRPSQNVSGASQSTTGRNNSSIGQHSGAGDSGYLSGHSSTLGSHTLTQSQQNRLVPGRTRTANPSSIPLTRPPIRQSATSTAQSVSQWSVGKVNNYREPLVARNKTSIANASAAGNGHASADGSNDIVCNCGDSALLLTVKKEGPNKGRQFYKCAKPQGSGCSFFLWTNTGDTNTANNNENSNYDSHNSSVGSSNYQSFTSFDRTSTAGGVDTVQCNCGQPAKSLTVMKDGPNKGRPFHGCPKPRVEGCNFFQWADADSSNSSSFNGQGGGRGQRNVNSAGDNESGPGEAKTRQKPKCSVCRQEGHRKNTCPSR